MDYQDVITKKADAVKIVDKTEWEMFHNKRYLPIIKALRKGPMTVKDLENEYNKIIEAQIEELAIPEKEKRTLIEKTKRKGKTLYKYLDVLVKNNVLIEAGKRVRLGQTASETLYGRSAQLFVFSGKEIDDKLVFEKKETWDVIGTIIRKERNKEEINITCLKKKIEKISKSLSITREKIFTKYSEMLSEHSPTISFEELNNIAWVLELFYLISSGSEFNKELEECFK